MSDETLHIMCPSLNCRKVLAVPVRARGKTVKCRGCGASIRIPKEKATAPTAEAASDEG